MNTLFPSPILVLTCVSLLTSTVTLIQGALVLYITPAMWIIPGAFIGTVAYHSLLALLTRSKPIRSTRWFSIFTVAAPYTLTAVWTAALTITLVFTTLISIRNFDIPEGPRQQSIRPLLFSISAFSLVQTIVVGAIAVLSHKERKRAQYQAKWQWNVTLNTSKWSITKETL
ncbi:hypothetical protein CC1G_03292 [Coprinopsis cinerea okayama7|uniref:Uncharacterized protein n=1 Tax=Coprinopsis cinerea (strain Okayama-7 / 130 / ATCC MYA-4618 / FGSC 9003) TaxID=240176 RepID=A8N7E9_COPC7|nr:hypothetical protein CC1G_03292 [Coprinopsis cinerea okayama7\|eukprot:XP_001830755.1 hypothetical protein CC1G_03292 [Coprinopsis cinerea okayama7\